MNKLASFLYTIDVDQLADVVFREDVLKLFHSEEYADRSDSTWEPR